MNIKVFGFILLYLVFITFIINASADFTINNGIDTSLGVADNATSGGAFDMLGTFFKLFLFEVGAFPLWASMIFIFPAVAVLWLMAIIMIIDIIPF